MGSRENKRAIQGVFGGFQPAPGTDQRSSPGARHRRGSGGSDRGPHTRDHKELLSPEEVLPTAPELAAQYGHQADRVVAQATNSGQHRMPDRRCSARAVTGRAIMFSKMGCADRRAILETALVRVWEKPRMPDPAGVRAPDRGRGVREFHRLELVNQFTTAAMERMEREIVRPDAGRQLARLQRSHAGFARICVSLRKTGTRN